MINNDTKPILTAQIGDNSDIFPDILELYAKHGDYIADVTYGKGVFWRNVDTDQYVFFSSDIESGIDYNDLPYEDEMMDMVVLDPPYMGHNGGKGYAVARNYNVAVPKYSKYYIPNLYFNGIIEAYNTLKVGGKLVIKCQDEIQSGKQNMNHITIIQFCLEHNFRVEDMFVVVQKNTPIMRHPYQLHARKNHSYFIVFTKTKKR